MNFILYENVIGPPNFRSILKKVMLWIIPPKNYMISVHICNYDAAPQVKHYKEETVEVEKCPACTDVVI